MTERLPLTALAYRAVAQAVRPGDRVIDATAGNGHDTAFLAHMIGPHGRVFAFDVQMAAIEATRLRLRALDLEDRVTLLHAGHERLDSLLPSHDKGLIAAAMFNLGYLPGGDKGQVTAPATTLEALAQAAEWLRPGGVFSVLVYPGHAGGENELDAVADWVASRSTLRPEPPMRSDHPASPVLFILTRLAALE